jgi:hypothetical protein
LLFALQHAFAAFFAQQELFAPHAVLHVHFPSFMHAFAPQTQALSPQHVIAAANPPAAPSARTSGTAAYMIYFFMINLLFYGFKNF